MVDDFYIYFAFFLIINIMLGFARVIKGPATSDRMIAVYLVGTMGAGVVLCLGHFYDNKSFYDVALTFSLLGPMALVIFVNSMWSKRVGKC